MTDLIARRRTIILLTLVIQIVSLACLSLTGSPVVTPQTSPTTESVPTQTQGPEVTSSSTESSPGAAEISVQGDLVFGTGGFDFLDPVAGLSELASYTATLSLTFVGTEAGQPSQWSKTYVMLNTLQPLARQVMITSAGQEADPGAVFMAEVAGAAYEQRNEQACTATAIEPGESPVKQLEPAGFLTGVIGANEAGGETVNGMEAQHYTFDERALGELGITHSTGEIWVAADGGYLVKYALVAQAGTDYFGEGIEGTITWDYELTDINLPVTIELPGDCPAGMIEAPRLPDATDLLNTPGLVSYITASTPAEAAAFYQKELPPLGWLPTSDPTVADTLALQDFTRGDQQLSVTILVDEDGTTVQLVLGLIQP